MSKKVAVITGASSGIGKATALLFAANNFNIALLARDGEKLRAVERELSRFNVTILRLECDVTKIVQVHAAAEAVRKQFGHIDVLVNNAGYAVHGPLETMAINDINGQMVTNYFGTVLCTKEFLADLKKSRGSIVNVASIAGLTGIPNMAAYAASKHAVIGLSESLRNEVLTEGVSISCVCPGKVKTELFKHESFKNVEWANDEGYGLTPKVVADEILRAVKERKFLYVLPRSSKWKLFAAEIMPKFLVNKVRGKT